MASWSGNIRPTDRRVPAFRLFPSGPCEYARPECQSIQRASNMTTNGKCGFLLWFLALGCGHGVVGFRFGLAGSSPASINCWAEPPSSLATKTCHTLQNEVWARVRNRWLALIELANQSTRLYNVILAFEAFELWLANSNCTSQRFQTLVWGFLRQIVYVAQTSASQVNKCRSIQSLFTSA